MKITGHVRLPSKSDIQTKRPVLLGHALVALWSLVFLFAAFTATVFAEDSAGGAPPAGTPSISDIQISDHSVTIKASGPFTYSIVKTIDPFRVSLILEGLTLGKFREKVFSKHDGVTEIIPSQKAPSVAQLDLLLQSPADLNAQMQDNALIVRIAADQPAAGKEAAGVQAAPARDTSALTARAGKIVDIFFDKTDKGVELVIKGDGMMPEPAISQVDGTVMIDIPDVALSASVPNKFPAPVKGLKQKAEKNKARFILDIEASTEAEAMALDDEIVIDLVSAKKAPGGHGAGSPVKQVANGNVVSLDIQDAEVIPILRLLADVGGYNIMVHPDVGKDPKDPKGEKPLKIVNMRLEKVPWEQAMDLILRTYSLQRVYDGKVMKIMPSSGETIVKTIENEAKIKENEAKLKENEAKAGLLETRVFPIRHVDVSLVEKAIKDSKVLTAWGGIGIFRQNEKLGEDKDPFERLISRRSTGSIVLTDVPAVIQKVEEIVRTLDKPEPQILIEARIIEINNNFLRSLGIEWGFKARPNDYMSIVSGSVPGADPTKPANVLGGKGAPALINLPATGVTAALAPTSAITFGYLNAAQTLGLDLRITAIEDIGKGRIVSNPRIVALNNEMAVIKQGAQIPVTTRGQNDTFSTVYKDANLKLKIVPQVLENGVFLKIEVNKDEPNFQFVDALGNPQIDTRSASTALLVKDGETVVIGGVLRIGEVKEDSGVPGLSRIPVLGYLFKRETKERINQEMIIFLTPRVMK
ncbi:MAG TPA: type IV pilus secretin PilQ [Dissulfurispiraceae bacterium]|nr:type IV pilus secretin PilQ [Dissulfurispiraceae bacterium]